jgi:hypothetical protein
MNRTSPSKGQRSTIWTVWILIGPPEAGRWVGANVALVPRLDNCPTYFRVAIVRGSADLGRSNTLPASETTPRSNRWAYRITALGRRLSPEWISPRVCRWFGRDTTAAIED